MGIGRRGRVLRAGSGVPPLGISRAGPPAPAGPAVLVAIFPSTPASGPHTTRLGMPGFAPAPAA